jgi:hypothetical protein
MRQQISFIAQWQAFHITEAIAEKLTTISGNIPCAIVTVFIALSVSCRYGSRQNL